MWCLMKRDSAEDVTFILYILPILINGLFGLWSWVAGGADLASLQKTYSNITREPVIFLAGLLAVCAAVILDVKYAAGSPEAVDRRVTRLAYFCFIAALIIALISAGFNLPRCLTLFLQGRYALIFPALLVALGFLIRLRGLVVSSKRLLRGLSLILLLFSPVTLYLLWRLSFAWFIIFSAPLILIVAALVLMVR